MTNQILVSLEAPKVGVKLLLAASILTGLHVITMCLWFNDVLPLDHWWQIAPFDLDEEESFGTWYSVMLLLAAGQLLLLQARLTCQRGMPRSVWWLMLGLGFHLLSIDEVVGIHEYIGTVFEDTSWTTFGGAIVLMVAFVYLPFLAALPARTRYLFVIAGAIYVGGAMGVERATDWYDVNDLLNTLAYNLWTAVEEFLEMSGIILFIYALLDHLARQKKPPSVSLHFTI